MGLAKDKLIYDGTTASDGDSVAAFLHASGGKLTSTNLSGKECLDVNIASPLAVDVDLDGIYDGVNNLTPDSAGIIGHTRAATPGISDQIERMTVGTASADGIVAANVHGLDVNGFLMGYNGTTWDRLKSTSGALDVNPLGNVADDDADSGNPLKIGSKAVSGALTAVSATGDRANAISDLYRRIYVKTAPNVAGSNAAVTVDDTAGGVPLFASPQAGRCRVLVQNLDNKEMYIGFGTVTIANGIRIAAGASWSDELGPDLALKAIRATGESGDVRVMQLA